MVLRKCGEILLIGSIQKRKGSQEIPYLAVTVSHTKAYCPLVTYRMKKCTINVFDESHLKRTP